jgi:hypothetical protein
MSMYFKFSREALELSTFPVIPEGEAIVRVKTVDESMLPVTSVVTLTLEDRSHATTRVNFDLSNPVSQSIYVRAVRAFIGDELLDDINHTDLIGKYARVEIIHKTGSRGGRFANVKRWLAHADGFDFSTPGDAASAALNTQPALPAPSPATDPFAELDMLAN